MTISCFQIDRVRRTDPGSSEFGLRKVRTRREPNEYPQTSQRSIIRFSTTIIF